MGEDSKERAAGLDEKNLPPITGTPSDTGIAARGCAGRKTGEISPGGA